MLAERTRVGKSTFFNGTRRFPGQIDGSGRNLIETLDDPGDITNIEFQLLTLDDTGQLSDDEREPSLDANRPSHSLAITITVRPKGKARRFMYTLHVCNCLWNTLNQHLNRQNARAILLLCYIEGPALH